MKCYNDVRREKCAGVAQLAEQLICNQQVGGSNPSTSSIFLLRTSEYYGGIPERPKGADCKSVVSDFGGPNPSSPTKKSKSYDLDFFIYAHQGITSFCNTCVKNFISV